MMVILQPKLQLKFRRVRKFPVNHKGWKGGRKEVCQPALAIKALLYLTLTVLIQIIDYVMGNKNYRLRNG